MMDSEEELQKIAGIGPTTAKKLAAGGYATIEAVARASPEELEGIVGDRGGALIAAAKEKLEEEIPEEVTVMAEEEKIPAVAEVEEVEKEQGPVLDLIDKITDKETTLNINIDDVGGKLFGRSLRLLGKVNIDLGTLKKAK